MAKSTHTPRNAHRSSFKSLSELLQGNGSVATQPDTAKTFNQKGSAQLLLDVPITEEIGDDSDLVVVKKAAYIS